MMKLFSLIITAFLFLACSSDKPASTGAKGPSEVRSGVSETLHRPGAAVDKPYALEITPIEATRKSILNLSSTGFDLSRAKIEWLVNGRPITTRVPAQFDGADATKGSTVQAKAMIQGQEVSSNIVKIVNTPPEISGIKLMPEVLKPGDTLGVEVNGEDADGDEVSFLYEWTKNGETVGKGSSIGTPLKRGDKVSARITPYDGTDYGTPVFLRKEIANWPPVIFEHKDFTFDGTEYTYQVKASDPDDDPLVYSLEAPLNGMTIHPSTGLLQWVVPPDFKGDKNVTVVVADGHGGIARYTLKITIQQQPPL